MNKKLEIAIDNFVKKSFFSEDAKKRYRSRKLKRLILNMPYTKTYYQYKKNPGSFFVEEEQDYLRES